MKKRNKAILQGVNDLLENKPANDWISTIFDMQNSLIESGALEGYTRLGFEQVAGEFAQLKNFFVALNKLGSK